MRADLTLGALSLTLLSSTTGVFAAGGWEVTLFGGWTAPTYEERFLYRPDIELPEVPGATLRQAGEFALTARGSFAFGGSVAYYFNDVVAIEARVDTVDFDIRTEAPVFTADFPLPAPLPEATAVLDLGTGVVDVERLYPLSVNLKLRTRGRTRFMASGGLSYLPRLRLNAVQTARLSVGALGLEIVEPASVAVQAEALPSEEGKGRLGFNGGLGLEVQLSENVSFVGEARVFLFDAQTFNWSRAGAPTTPLELILLEELEEELQPLELEPTYFQVSAGVVIRF